MNRFKKISQFIIVSLMIIALINYDRLGDIVKALDNGNGILVGGFNFISSYFTHADAWNLIILSMTFVGGLILFSTTSLLFENRLTYLRKRYNRFAFTSKEWFTWVRSGMVGITLLLLFILASNLLVIVNATRFTVENVDEIEESLPVAIFGANKKLSSGKGENVYFTQRIEAGVKLWNEGKAQYFILTGDRTDAMDYDETEDMKQALIEAGVPEEAIRYKDGKGFRTLDSVLRLRSEYKVDKVIVVSQKFHTERAVFLAWFYGIEAIAYNAEGSATIAMVIRETFGKVKMLSDLYAFNMQPRAKSYNDYRKDFEVESDGDVVLLVLITFLVVYVLRITFKAMENNTKGIYKNLIFSFAVLTGTIILAVSAYETTDILDPALKVVAEKTGIGKEAVERKEKAKEVAKQLAEEIKVQKRVEAVKYDSLYSLSDQGIKAIDSLISDNSSKLLPNMENINTISASEENDKIIKGLSISEKEESNEKLEGDNIQLEKKPNQEDNPFAGLAINTQDQEDEDYLANEVKKESKFIGSVDLGVRGTQLIKNNSSVSLRVLNNVLIDGVVVKKNTPLNARAHIIEDRLELEVKLNNNLKGVAYDDKGNKGINITQLDKLDDSFVLSDGFKFTGRF